jgi:DNA mismatch repair protein MutS
MQVDKTTLYDLSVFHREDEYSLFAKIDFTRTAEGRSVLYHLFSSPFNTLPDIIETQQILSIYQEKIEQWPFRITNGTLLIIEKFLDENPDSIPRHPDFLRALLYKLLHPSDFAMIHFSMKQIFEFIKGFEEIIQFFDKQPLPVKLADLLEQASRIINDKRLSAFKSYDSFTSISRSSLLAYAAVFHIDMVAPIRKLITVYGQLDAWYAMAVANNKLQLSFPVFKEQIEPLINATSLRHVMLATPVAYDLQMDKNANFIFLTGANMAGKSTLIKAVGLSVYLAHLGMGVPAAAMQLTLFDGILTNINVEDNLVKGESYFFNEVKRIRETIIKITNGKRWLVLIDEIFKGTNIQDAMKCSTAVIKGLIKMQNGLFILSTHLYEIGEELKPLPSISFKYFETQLVNNELFFSYQLKDGISQDRMGYLILQKEGVTALLDEIGNPNPPFKHPQL